ncbi:hypothetical protein [Paenibacillus massiliensis]|uniref:hypothetical protein n=1 Tax=Paenibacillus massiliensis TaxID=225917 RepID=UPI00048ACA18|nr:hypothetical protein [Paenibacillus massiliensis]
MRVAKLILAVSLVISNIVFFTPVSASPEVSQNLEKQNTKETYDVIVQGEKIGTKTIHLEIEREIEGEDITVNLVAETRYNLNSNATEVQKEVLQIV